MASLGKLRAAIRAAPKVKGRTRIGDIPFEKTAFLEALGNHFDNDRSAETGLKLDADGVIVRDE